VAPPMAYACCSADSALHRLREIEAVVGRQTSNEVSMPVNLDSRALAISAFTVRAMDVSSSTSKTLRSLLFAVCNSTLNKASEYVI
jgi:hypothetical protein